MKRLVVAAVIVACGCNPQPGPTPGETCPAVHSKATADDGTELVCDEAGRWRRARFEGGS